MARDTLNTLIRLAGTEVDEARRALQDLLAQEDALIAAMGALDEAVAKEQRETGPDPTMRAALSAFLIRARDEMAALQQQRQELQPQIAEARDALAEAFANQKKYEIAQENRAFAEAAEDARKETLFLDEIAITAHNRKA